MRACTTELANFFNRLGHDFDSADNQLAVVELVKITLSNAAVYCFSLGDSVIKIGGTGSAFMLPNTGAGIAAGNIDPNYSFTRLQGTATGANGYAYVPNQGTHYISQSNDPAKFLTPSINGSESYDVLSGENGIYRYRLSFDLSTFDLSTVELSGDVFADNSVDVYLNDALLVSGAGVAWPFAFSASSGFVSGINHLDFVVTNYLSNNSLAENPTGLIVQFNNVQGVQYEYVFVPMAIERDDITQQAGIEVDETKLKLYCNDETKFNNLPAPQFALNGGFDNALIEISLAIMDDQFVSVGLLHLFTGRVTDTTIDRALIELSVSSDKIKLDTQVPTKIYQPSCTHTLYDAGCKLLKDNWKESNSAISGSNQTSIQFNTVNGENFFSLGKIVFSSGQNTGIARTVKYFAKSGGVGIATLAQPLPFAVAIGDTFDIYAGCDKLRGTCSAKFNNAAQFLGWEYMPVPEASI